MIHNFYYVAAGLIIFAVDLITLLDIFDTDREPECKVGWAVCVLALPLLGAIIWFIFGRQKEPRDYFSGPNDLL